MKVLVKIVKFTFVNRRVIGLMIGSALTLAGLPEYGKFAVNVGES